MVRRACERAERQVGLLADLPGPKLRLGNIDGGLRQLRNGQNLTLTVDPDRGPQDALSVAWAGLPAAVSRGDTIYLADGSIRLRVRESGDSDVLTRVETGGTIASHQGINLPGVDATPASVGEEDLAWVDFAVEQDIDLIAVSFVRHASDLEPVFARLAERGADTPGDRQDREARGGRERRGDRPEVHRRRDGRARRPRDRAADRDDPADPEAAAEPRRAATPSPRSRRPRCSRRWSPRRARRAPRRPTSPTRSSTAPTR